MYHSLREARVNPKGVYTCDRTDTLLPFHLLKTRFTLFSEWKSIDTSLGSNVWSPSRSLLNTRENLYSCPSLTKKSKWTHQFTFMSPTAFSSLLCARNMTHTYHENKKIRYVYIAVEIISGFFFPATSKKLWLCFQCGKRYMWKDSLKKHLRVECGKEPTYECPICGRKFKHKHRWQSHARLIHYLDIWLTKQARV